MINEMGYASGRKSLVAIAIMIALSVAPAWAQNGGNLGPGTTGKELLQKVSIEQKLNAQVPADLTFHDETGRLVKLGDYFGVRPIILTLNYYRCPMLCSQELNGLVSALNVLKFEPGKDFEIVTASIDPTETPIIAADAKKNYLARYMRQGAESDWHFLTGDQQNIDRLASAVGFHYAFDPESRQFAHASGIMVLTPDGKIAQYFYGIEFSPKDLRLGLVQASKGKIGSIVDQLVLLCYHYDPTIGKYTLTVLRVLKAAGAATLLALGVLIGMLLYKEKGAGAKRMSVGQGDNK